MLNASVRQKNTVKKKKQKNKTAESDQTTEIKIHRRAESESKVCSAEGRVESGGEEKERLSTGVRSQVAGEGVAAPAGVAAEGAFEGLLAGVQLDVSQQVSLLGE